MSSFFAYISRMKYITRWALMRNTTSENLAEHSYFVAVIAHALATISNEKFGNNVDVGKVVASALYHDCSEILTGDMPTPVKYANETITNAYKEIEREASKRLFDTLEEELKPGFLEAFHSSDETVNKFVHAADKLSALIKCMEELKANNSEFFIAKAHIEEAIKNMDMPEVKYFMENFLEPFGKTLDEI